MSHSSDLISSDILAYLAQHERKELLRFLTCGNVDDGKSTLIGRLLHDSKMIYEDHLEAITRDSKKVGTTGEDVDLALLVDGLQAEREQGITIDVAYRYFSTAKRKFIIADTPGHEQYTRNMATGASTCDLAIILIDARYGVQTQTRRHSFIASLLGEVGEDVGRNQIGTMRHTLIMIDDERILEYLSDEEKARITRKMVRFRTLGCYPLTGAVESSAATLPDIIQEMLLTRTSERQGRVIDHDQTGSMEEKKRQGYF